MENLKNISLPHTAVAVTLLALNHLDLIPCIVTDVLRNRMVKLALAAGIVATSYNNSIENAVVLAAVLYVALNSEEPSSDVTPDEPVVEEPVEEKDTTDVKGVESEPHLEPVADPLPTQDNSAPVESKDMPVTPEPASEPDTDQVVEGFSGLNDMASV